MRLCLSGVGYQDEFDMLMKLNGIVIDEFGSEGRMHPNAKERVLNLIWEMHNKNKLVILTSSIPTVGEIGEQYGGGLVSRIQQRGGFMLLSGKDYRLKKG
jgi:DNA replication protein DnaC